MKTFVVIPAYNEASFISDVIRNIPEEMERIVVVDDCSSDETAAVVDGLGDRRVHLIRHEQNRGVGGAVVTGYKYALENGADIVVKLDGDGQMDPRLIPGITAPITEGHADYTKGARFLDAGTLKRMPLIRLLGNIVLSFVAKFVSGYWGIFDPANGFTAIHKEALSRLPLDDIAEGYFFETDMLIRLYRVQAVVTDVQIPIRYGSEESQLQPFRIAPSFFFLLSREHFRRILWRYFIIDFNAVSLFLILGAPLFLYGFLFGLFTWIKNAAAQVLTPTGTIMVAVVPLFFGFQFLLQALVLDINNAPQLPLQTMRKRN